MNNTTEVDEVREAVLKIAGQIKNLAETLPLMYDSTKTLVDQFPETHREIHLSNIVVHLNLISEIAREGEQLIRDLADKKEASHG